MWSAQIFDCFIFQRRPIRMQYGETRISVKDPDQTPSY